MHLATKGRFAVTGLLDVALNERAGPVRLKDIGARQKISLSYLEQLFSRMGRCRLVASTRGPGGGYMLAHKAADITLAQVFQAVDGDVVGGRSRRDDPVEPAPANGCRLNEELWAGINARLMDCLATITLQDLVNEQVARGVRLLPPRPAATPISRAIAPRPAAPPSPSPPNSVFALGESMA
jgi:Rrf2 family iron-sulfur cluster assembly transcriptional regulator